MLLKEDCYLTDRCVKFKANTCTEKFCPMLFSVDSLFNSALLSDKQKEKISLIPFTTHDKEQFMILQSIENDIVNFVKNGNSLFVHSTTCGNGKTSWAIKMIHDYILKIWPGSTGCKALFINVPRFLLSLKESITTKSEYVDHIKQNVLKADLVVWDEVGVKTLTPYEHEQLLNLINTRLDMGKSNIYTSNLTSNDLCEKIGERLYSRIKLAVNIEFIGPDVRGKQVSV